MDSLDHLLEPIIMSLMKLFSGPTPEKLEMKGDAHLAASQWGQAKQAYERALHKLKKNAASDTRRHQLLQNKIQQACEALARGHQEDAINYLDGGYTDEARAALTLALEISSDQAFRDELTAQLAALSARPDADDRSLERMPDHIASLDDDGTASDPAASQAEYFQALCHTLPEAVGKAYQGYGDDFIDGYIALNNGDFDTAVTHLERALAATPRPDSFIPLELATAYMNNGRLEEARELLEQVRLYHPEALPVYQLLCEIYWEQSEIAQADALLASLPPHLAQSRAVMHLKGETLHRAGQFDKARDFYRFFLETYGWDDGMAKELAKAHEALHEPSEARRLYREIMGRCSSCHARVDPQIKHQYAEISFAEGVKDQELLEIYLSLAREIPTNAALYFDRISQIYFSQGNTADGERFRAFALRAQTEQNPPPL
jgi:tetratricopeptide (TPR) repeat protein